VLKVKNPAVKAELDIVLAVHLVQRCGKLSGVLAQTVIAVGIGADIGVAGRGILVDKDRGHSIEPIGL